MEIERRTLSDGTPRWRVRWRQGQRRRVQTFDRKRDAQNFAAELRRRQQLGTASSIDSGRTSLAEYVTTVWAPTVGVYLSEVTRRNYSHIYDKHILPARRGTRSHRARRFDRSRRRRLSACATRVRRGTRR